MSAVAEPRWDGKPVQIVRSGAVQTVTYRHAVSLISRGLATWHTPTVIKPEIVAGGKGGGSGKRGKAAPAPVETVLVPEKGPELFPLPTDAAKPSDPFTVSNPATGAEVDQAGYEPPLPDL